MFRILTEDLFQFSFWQKNTENSPNVMKTINVSQFMDYVKNKIKEVLNFMSNKKTFLVLTSTVAMYTLKWYIKFL